MLGGMSPGHHRERRWSPLPVPCLLALRGVTGSVVGGTGDDGHVLPLAACPPSCPRRQPGPCLLHSGRAGSRGGLDNARPLALKIHAKQLFPLGACSWMRLGSGSRGAERGEEGRGGDDGHTRP